MKIQTVCLASVLFLSGCTTPPAPESPADQTASALPARWPQCAALDATWGLVRGPSLQLNGNQGVYWLKPGSRKHVTIAYEGTAQPREIRTAEGILASDGKLTIMGQTVDFYGSGNEDAEITTQAIALEIPGGCRGWFTFSFSAPEHLKGRNIPAFTW
jgi:hypothetical protein